jgi:uncharacterized protein DUF4388
VNDHQRPLAQSGAWRLLEATSELLRALRDGPGTLFNELSELSPSRAVLAGDLAEMLPCDLLNFLHQGRRTGVLLTRADGVERGIVMLDGNVAWACSTSPGELLGELLARSGLADRNRVAKVLLEQREPPARKRLGELLVEEGVLSPEGLARGLRHQVVEIFLGLLVVKSGHFVFLRGVDRAALPSVLALDTQGMLLDGLCRLDEMEVYRTRVPNADAVPRCTGKIADGDLAEDARRVLAAADGRRTVADLARATALGEFEATRAAYRLIELGYLRL